MSNQERLAAVGLFYLGVALYFGAEYFYHRERELGSLTDGTPVTGGRLKDGTFYRSVVAPENREDLVALLLHGSAFSSKTWESIGTLEFLKNDMNLSSIAVDLPSYKDSKSVPVPKNKLAYLINLIFELKVFDDKRIILIAASVGGAYALPYVLQNPEKLAAFIALTPATANAYGPSTFSQVLVPTLYVYGTKDKNTGKRFSELFEKMPNCEIMQLEGSNHFYTDYPDKWHDTLREFLQRLTLLSDTG